jgi:hypothetical protein
MRKACEYRDREGNLSAGCLLEFEPNAGRGGSNRKHCDVCKTLAARDRGAAHVSRHSERHSKRNRDQRRRAAEDDGRVYRPMDRLQPCLYLDRAGKPGPHCLREFTPKTGGQIYCDNCRPLARRDRQAKAALQLYRDLKAQRKAGEASPGYEKRLQWGRTSAANYHERQRKLATQGKILAAVASMNSLRQKIAMALLIDRSSGNEQVKQLVLKLTGESISTSTVERVRTEMGLARKKGRPGQNL